MHLTFLLIKATTHWKGAMPKSIEVRKNVDKKLGFLIFPRP